MGEAEDAGSMGLSRCREGFSYKIIPPNLPVKIPNIPIFAARLAGPGAVQDEFAHSRFLQKV